MANDVSNVTGTQDGSQKLGTVTFKAGHGATSINTVDQSIGSAGHIGDFENPTALIISDVDQKLDDRFENKGDKFFINEGTGLASTSVFHTDGHWGLWRNTNDGVIVIAVNASGTIRTGTLS